MSRLLFTGERLHEGNELFGVDLVRHRAAYAHAIESACDEGRRRVLDLGCGTGYGAALLAEARFEVWALDRIAPDPDARHAAVRYLRADAGGLPLLPGRFDLVVSFQVIEHLLDPRDYLQSIAQLLAPGGCALISTPNRLTSDGENPFHVREYVADELTARLREHFATVEMLGVTATPAAMAYFDERLRRIRRIVRLDPLGVRRALPRWLVDWLFARFAVLVRRGIAQSSGLPPVGLADFPIVPADARCLDLLAVCRSPVLGDASRSAQTEGAAGAGRSHLPRSFE